MPTRRDTVLVVEDNDDLRHLFRDRLKAAGFDVREASDGMQALRLIEAAPPDLVVLDIGPVSFRKQRSDRPVPGWFL